MRRHTEWLLLPLAVLPAAGLLAFVLWARSDYLAETQGTGREILADGPRLLGVVPAEVERAFLRANEYEEQADDFRIRWTTAEGIALPFRVRCGFQDGAPPLDWIIVEGPLPGLAATSLADRELRLALESGTPAARTPDAQEALRAVDRLVREFSLTELAAAPLSARTKLYLLRRHTSAWFAENATSRRPGYGPDATLWRAQRLLGTLVRGGPVAAGPSGPEFPGALRVVRAGLAREPLLRTSTGSVGTAVLRWREPERGRLELLYHLQPWEPLLRDEPDNRRWTVWSEAPYPGRWTLLTPHGDRWWEDRVFRRWIGPAALGALGLTAIPLLLWLELRRRRRLDDARVRFLGEVAHDLRTPLSALRVHAELLAQDRLPEERRAGSAHRVAREASRLSGLLANLLDLTRLERGTRAFRAEALDLRGVIDDAARDFRLLHEERAPDLQVTVGDDARVDADRTALRRALDNLLDNAAKYTPPGTPVHVSGVVEGGAVRVTVADEGPGIPADERPRLFERYHRGSGAREGGVAGSGLGLALVRELMRGMGGDVELEEAERGARFALRLRRAR